jgi:hypothetical protein
MTRPPSLVSGIRAAIRIGTPRPTGANLTHWSKTYPGSTEEDVDHTWADEMTKIPPSIEGGCEK